MDKSLSLRVLSTNARSLRHKFHELGVFVDGLKALIAALIETWIVHDFDVTPGLLEYNYLRNR